MKDIQHLAKLLVLFILISPMARAQARLIINGGVITVNNGASLVIDNPDNTAITTSGAGYIQSEAISNRIIWTIGTGNGNMYVVPFGNAAGYFPLQFNAASGIGATGQFVFSTYPTPTWKNSDYLPTGVTNVNRGTNDNSGKVIDGSGKLNRRDIRQNLRLQILVLLILIPNMRPPILSRK